MSYYKESGKISVGATLLSSAIGLSVVAFLAYGYAFVTEINPFIYFNFIATAIYVIILYAVLNLIKTFGKIRSFGVFLFLGVIFSLFGLIAVWVSYVAFAFDENLEFALSNFGRAIGILSDTSFSIGRALRSSSLEISGGILMALWAIEALILVGGPIFFVNAQGKNDNVFCEECNAWADNEKVFKKISPDPLSKEQLEGMIHSNRLSELFELKDMMGEPAYYKVQLTSCEKCSSKYYLSVASIVHTKNKKGEDQEDETLVLPFYELDMHAVPRLVLNPNQ